MLKANKHKNDDRCIEDLMYIYKRFVKDHIEEILENKKKDPETIEELERQLHYMKKAIEVLKSSTARIQKRTKASIIQNRHDNEQLIGDLDSVRKKKKTLEKQKEELELQIGELRLEKQSRERDFEKKLHEMHKHVNA